MPSLMFDIGERGRTVARFIAHVRSELQRAFVAERRENKLTQQAIAQKLGVNRSVINRQLTGIENLTVKRVIELAWAMGWEVKFSLEKSSGGGNYFTPDAPPPPATIRSATESSGGASLRLTV